MMRRNDFKAVADVIRKHHTHRTIDPIPLREMIDDLCFYFRQSNPSFDKSKFVRACGWYDE